MTDQASNRSLPVSGGVDVVTVADDLVIEAHLSDQAFHSDQGASTETDARSRGRTNGQDMNAQETERLKSFSADADNEDKIGRILSSFPPTFEVKETSYVFKEEASMFSGSSAMPINVEGGPDPIS